MTKWTEQPLRAHGSPWPGQDTRGGFLDDGSGKLQDGSINCQINAADILSKRSGFTRGLDEWFGSVVCGLFTYQDYCGNEFLLVADEEEINIRQPFLLPQFLASDAYPNDDFRGSGPINVSNWRDTDRYVRLDGVMVQDAGAANFTGLRLPTDQFMRWFKDAGALAYEITINYLFANSVADEQRIGVIIRGNGDLSTGALLQMDLIFSSAGTYQVQLISRDAGDNYTTLLTEDLVGSTVTPGGTAIFRYVRDPEKNEFRPTAQILPTLGELKNVAAPSSLTPLQDADLGFVSALAASQRGGFTQSVGVEIVTGGPI